MSAPPPARLRVLFAECPEPYFGRAGEAPLRLATAAAAARAAGHDVGLEDGGVHEGFEAWAGAARAFAPDVLFIHGDTKHLRLAERLAAASRRFPKPPLVVLWGNHSDALDLRTLEELPDVGVVLRHDPEATLVALLARAAAAGSCRDARFEGIAGLTWRDSVTGGLARETDAPRMRMDDVPFPARDLIRAERYHDFRGPVLGQLFTARGCVYQCSFCEEANTPVATRSAARVVDEMSEIAERFGVRRFTFRDPLFGPRRHLLAVCHEIRARLPGVSFYCLTHPNQVDVETADALAAAGCWCVDMGVESGNAEVLASYGKGSTLESVRRAVSLLKERGIRVQLNLVLGGPRDTPETIRESVEFFLSLAPDYHCVTLCQPVPGSPLWQELSASGRMQEPSRWEDFYTNPFYTLRDGHADWSVTPRHDRMIRLEPAVLEELGRAYSRLGRAMMRVRALSAARSLFTGEIFRAGTAARLWRDARRAVTLSVR